jgi:hypothetical protein
MEIPITTGGNIAPPSDVPFATSIAHAGIPKDFIPVANPHNDQKILDNLPQEKPRSQSLCCEDNS